MSLDKEQAHRLADQIMDEAKQESIAKLNERKIRISFIYYHTGLMQLQPYQQAKIIQQAKEKALDHPVFQKAFYFYAFFGFHFFIYVLKTSKFISTIDVYVTMLLAFALTAFELWRAYWVYHYVREILRHHPENR